MSLIVVDAEDLNSLKSSYDLL